jgi:hypothetical protein
VRSRVRQLICWLCPPRKRNSNLAKITDPFATGWEAGIRGDGPASCPYAAGTRDAKEWIEWYEIGSNLAEAMREQRDQGIRGYKTLGAGSGSPFCGRD